MLRVRDKAMRCLSTQQNRRARGSVTIFGLQHLHVVLHQYTSEVVQGPSSVTEPTNYTDLSTLHKYKNV